MKTMVRASALTVRSGAVAGVLIRWGMRDAYGLRFSEGSVQSGAVPVRALDLPWEGVGRVTATDGGLLLDVADVPSAAEAFRARLTYAPLGADLHGAPTVTLARPVEVVLVPAALNRAPGAEFETPLPVDALRAIKEDQGQAVTRRLGRVVRDNATEANRV